MRHAITCNQVRSLLWASPFLFSFLACHPNIVTTLCLLSPQRNWKQVEFSFMLEKSSNTW